jgi:hypothetical protein
LKLQVCANHVLVRHLVELAGSQRVPTVVRCRGAAKGSPSLVGRWAICRVTTSTSAKRDHIARRVSYAPPAEDGDYERNIQIADLNALTASMAVIRWKKFCGFYQDLEGEHDSTYSTNCNLLTGDETA